MRWLVDYRKKVCAIRRIIARFPSRGVLTPEVCHVGGNGQESTRFSCTGGAVISRVLTGAVVVEGLPGDYVRQSYQRQEV